MSRARELAEAHIEYVIEIIEAHGASVREIEIARAHYVTAFMHGYKHAEEDIAEKTKTINTAPFAINAPFAYSDGPLRGIKIGGGFIPTEPITTYGSASATNMIDIMAGGGIKLGNIE